MTVRRLIVAAALLLPAAGQAQTEPANPFAGLHNAPHLIQSDLVLIDKGADKLLAAENPRPGTHETWTNRSTGAHGTTVLRGPVTRTVQGGQVACRALRYDVSVRGRKDPQSYDVEWCRLPDGTWKAM